MTWQKREEGRIARLELLLDNETHPFHGMSRSINAVEKINTSPINISYVNTS